MTMATDWPSNAPEPHQKGYMMCRMKGDEILPLLGTTPITEEEAAARFQERHGYPPEYIIANYYGYLWLGPVEGSA